MNAYFAARGWILILPLLIVLVARLASDAPLKPEWLIYVIAAAALRLWAGAHLGAHGNDARANAPRLARTGPYRLSRNPLYISNILAAAGLILFANVLALPVALALIALVIVHHMVLVFHEEAVLRGLYGDAYERYRAHVPRWWGLLRPQAFSQHETRPEEDESPREPATFSSAFRRSMRRQGRNLGYLALCVLVVWAAARFA